MNNGSRVVAASNHLIKTIQESLGGIRDIILTNTQHSYIETYSLYDRTQRMLLAINYYLGIFPKYVMESSGLVVLAIGGVYLAFVSNNSNAIVPILGSYALGSQKLLPALQIIYNGWSNVKASSADLTTVINSLSYSLTQIPTLSRGFEFSRKSNLKMFLTLIPVLTIYSQQYFCVNQ